MSSETPTHPASTADQLAVADLRAVVDLAGDRGECVVMILLVLRRMVRHGRRQSVTCRYVELLVAPSWTARLDVPLLDEP